MANFNKVILMGNLTRDPEVRYTPKGTAIAKLGLAVNRKYSVDGGETREETTFIDIDAFGKQAELISQYLRKGNPIFVEGRLKLDQWEDKNTGSKASKLKVILEAFQFIGGPRSEGAGGGGMDEGSGSSAPRSHAAPAQRPAPRPSAPAESGPDSEEDDVPF
jgi:single-strand DNA-binding protein